MTNRKNIRQIGFLVKDLNNAVEQWNAFLGVAPSISEVADQEITKATLDGKPCFGKVRQAIYRLDNIEIELIMPINSEDSYWKECLDENGEGFHHIAFETDHMQESLCEMNQEGYPVRQHGYWPDDPVDGQYAYADATKQLHTVIELLDFGK